VTKYIKTKPSKKTEKSTDIVGLVAATVLAVALFGGMIWFILYMLLNGDV